VANNFLPTSNFFEVAEDRIHAVESLPLKSDSSAIAVRIICGIGKGVLDKGSRLFMAGKQVRFITVLAPDGHLLKVGKC
jgi:hypothetical protein